VSALRPVESAASWPAAWDVFDPELWPEGRAEWHLARARACPDRVVKLTEIRCASQRLWLHEPERYRALGYV
jgi:hypothetical protein